MTQVMLSGGLDLSRNVFFLFVRMIFVTRYGSRTELLRILISPGRHW